MKSVLTGGLVSFVAAGLSFGAGLPRTEVRGTYIEARNADVFTGPCFANGEVNLTGDLAVFGWNIEKGSFEGTQLDGLSVVGVIRASNTLGNSTETVYPVKSVLIIDQRANPEQRLALKGFAKRMAGDLLSEIVRVDYQPIQLAVAGNNVHTASANLTAGTLARIQTRAISDGDHICHNEEVWYKPLNKTEHAMPAVAVSNSFKGQGLDTVWSSPDKRSAFVATFHYGE